MGGSTEGEEEGSDGEENRFQAGEGEEAKGRLTRSRGKRGREADGGFHLLGPEFAFVSDPRFLAQFTAGSDTFSQLAGATGSCISLFP